MGGFIFGVLVYAVIRGYLYYKHDLVPRWAEEARLKREAEEKLLEEQRKRDEKFMDTLMKKYYGSGSHSSYHPPSSGSYDDDDYSGDSYDDSDSDHFQGTGAPYV